MNIAEGFPGIQRRLAQLAKLAGIEISGTLDPVFEVLYPLEATDPRGSKAASFPA